MRGRAMEVAQFGEARRHRGDGEVGHLDVTQPINASPPPLLTAAVSAPPYATGKRPG